MSLIVHKAGMLASIQDAGRLGFQHMGIPVSGAMDQRSMQIVNVICGNGPHLPIIEFTLHGAVIEFDQLHFIALAGGGAVATINQQPIPYHQLIAVQAGSVLRLHPSPTGCYSYLAIAGGFKVEPELGSCSTFALANLGGLNGNHLKAGDTIEVNSSEDEKELYEQTGTKFQSGCCISPTNITILNTALHNNNVTIRCHQGPEWEKFDRTSQESFFRQYWTVSNEANRMGYRLNGGPLKLRDQEEMISTPVTRGIIQVTSSGQPIVLMADAQTIGGYPRIGRIHREDFPVIAQSRPGTIIEFILAE